MAPGLVVNPTIRPSSNGTKPEVKTTAPSSPTHLAEWDGGVFGVELLQGGLTPRPIDVKAANVQKTNLITPQDVKQQAPLKKGTFSGTQKALTEMYRRTEHRFQSYFDVTNFESSIPQSLSTEEKQGLYEYQLPGSDGYPPHLALIPKKDQTAFLSIFNAMRLLDTASVLTRLVPDQIEDFLHSDPQSNTLNGLTRRNQELRKLKKDIFADPNIGDRDDWYSDALFAQQRFTGTDPTMIQAASKAWISDFKTAAESQSNNAMRDLLTSTDSSSLYVVDYSYFREAIQIEPHATMKSEEDVSWLRRLEGVFSSAVRNDDANRYACAGVCLFRLEDSGVLHPLAIVTDYKNSTAESVVIFNKKLNSTDHHDEANDWPWRYAKSCMQVSDWTRHEISAHLTLCHFVEEAVIVAAHRNFAESHPVFKLLQPHWLKTLSLNAAARSTLVPSVISKISGMKDSQLHNFIFYAYDNYDFAGGYIPVDLERRGFPPSKIRTDKKYAKYTYARNMLDMWQALHDFVAGMLAVDYPNDAAVQNDDYLDAWATEMRAPWGGNLKTFPARFNTVAELVDVCTMCIHIASPQHTAVNYTQDYYQSFVANKPPCFAKAPPASRAELMKFTEIDLMNALPVNAPRTWLLASHLPHLLSFQVAQDQNLITYAKSVQLLAGQAGNDPVKKAADKLLTDLARLGGVFDVRSQELVNGGDVEYKVLDPVMTAVSILI